MGRGKEVIALAIFLTGFLLTVFNPVSLSFSRETAVGLGLLVLFGALVTLSGLVNMPAPYLAPLGLLVVLDLRAAGLLLFALVGSSRASSREGNMVEPRIPAVAAAAFTGYVFFILASVAVAFPALEFYIPDPVMGAAVGMLQPAIGCELSATGQECVERKVDAFMDRQCDAGSQCEQLLEGQRGQLEAQTLEELSSQFPGFALNSTVGSALKQTLRFQVEQLIRPYQDVFRVIMAFVLFSVFQFLSGPLTLLAAGLTIAMLWGMEKADMVHKEKVRVKKVKFSA